MKKGKISSAIVLLINIAAFAALGIFAGRMISSEENIFIVLLYLLCASIMGVIAFISHVIVHETGHLFFGLITGYKFFSFRIFNLMWQKKDDGSIRLCKFNVAGTGGQCIMLPPETGNGSFPFFWYNAGGVIMNLIVSGVFMILYFIFKGNTYLQFMCISFLILGLSMGIVNSVPLPGIANDGMNIVELRKSETAKRAFYLQLKTIVMLNQGKRIRELPDEWFIMPSDEDMRNTMGCIMAVMICDKLFDERKFDEMQAFTDDLLAKDNAISSVHRELLKTNALFCELIGGMDSNKIESYLDKDLIRFMKVMNSYPGVIRTRYSYELLYKRNKTEAIKQLEQFEKTAKTYPYSTEIESERECIELARSFYTE